MTLDVAGSMEQLGPSRVERMVGYLLIEESARN
jgi:hypothetical protein